MRLKEIESEAGGAVNRKVLLYGFLVVIGFVDAFLNGWVYLLGRETRPLLLAGMGVLIMIAGAVNIRRELKSQRANK